MVGLKVNFSDQEAASEARDFTPVATGKYYARITDVEDKECGPESKNPGKPYWNIKFTIQDGPFENSNVWTNCMLFDGALYTLSQLLKATGHADALKTGKVPDGLDFVGSEVIVSVVKQKDKYKDPDGTEGLYKSEVKGILAYEGASPT